MNFILVRNLGNKKRNFKFEDKEEKPNSKGLIHFIEWNIKDKFVVIICCFLYYNYYRFSWTEKLEFLVF